MNNQTPSPAPENQLYALLQQAMQQGRGSADNTGIIVLGCLLGFFSFVLCFFLVIAKPGVTDPLLPNRENITITDTQGNPPQAK